MQEDFMVWMRFFQVIPFLSQINHDKNHLLVLGKNSLPQPFSDLGTCILI
jgi:hypothetical protein